jgi:hypothetical protein
MVKERAAFLFLEPRSRDNFGSRNDQAPNHVLRDAITRQSPLILAKLPVLLDSECE